MFAYEISYNHSTLKFLDSTRKIGYDENAEHITGEPFAINLNFLGGVRLKIASNQTNEVYKAYFNELSKLDKEDITLIMDYYHEQSILMKGIQTAQQSMNNKNIDLDVAGFSLEQHFLNELNLSNIILKRYKHLLAQHPKNPEMKDDNH